MVNMKSEKELALLSQSMVSWKYSKLWRFVHDYEIFHGAWKAVSIMFPKDKDAISFVRMYETVYEAINSLEDNPNAYVEYAMDIAIHKTRKKMDTIIGMNPILKECISILKEKVNE